MVESGWIWKSVKIAGHAKTLKLWYNTLPRLRKVYLTSVNLVSSSVTKRIGASPRPEDENMSNSFTKMGKRWLTFPQKNEQSLSSLAIRKTIAARAISGAYAPNTEGWWHLYHYNYSTGGSTLAVDSMKPIWQRTLVIIKSGASRSSRRGGPQSEGKRKEGHTANGERRTTRNEA